MVECEELVCLELPYLILDINIDYSQYNFHNLFSVLQN